MSYSIKERGIKGYIRRELAVRKKDPMHSSDELIRSIRRTKGKFKSGVERAAKRGGEPLFVKDSPSKKRGEDAEGTLKAMQSPAAKALGYGVTSDPAPFPHKRGTKYKHTLQRSPRLEQFPKSKDVGKQRDDKWSGGISTQKPKKISPPEKNKPRARRKDEEVSLAEQLEFIKEVTQRSLPAEPGMTVKKPFFGSKLLTRLTRPLTKGGRRWGRLQKQLQGPTVKGHTLKGEPKWTKPSEPWKARQQRIKSASEKGSDFPDTGGPEVKAADPYEPKRPWSAPGEKGEIERGGQKLPVTRRAETDDPLDPRDRGDVGKQPGLRGGAEKTRTSDVGTPSSRRKASGETEPWARRAHGFMSRGILGKLGRAVDPDRSTRRRIDREDPAGLGAGRGAGLGPEAEDRAEGAGLALRGRQRRRKSTMQRALDAEAGRTGQEPPEVSWTKYDGPSLAETSEEEEKRKEEDQRLRRERAYKFLTTVKSRS